MDSRSRRNINRLNDELHDIQRIVVQNIDEVLQRGEAISGAVNMNCSDYILCHFRTGRLFSF